MLLTTEALPATMRPRPDGVHECTYPGCAWAQEAVQSEA